jgi:hypothetical protein
VPVRKLILLTDHGAFAEFRKSSGLPPDCIEDALDRVRRRADDERGVARDFRIKHVDPSILVPIDPEAEVAAEHAQQQTPNGVVMEDIRDEIFGELLTCTVCHLVVLENELEAVQGLSGQERVVLQDDSRLQALRRWYERFTEEAIRRVGEKRVNEYRHYLILVCAEEIPERFFESFQALVKPVDGHVQASPLIKNVYVMLRKLEIGEEHVLHSRYVWPMYVGRLCTQLLYEAGSTPRSQPCNAQVWRCLEIAAELDKTAVESILADAVRRAYETTQENVFVDTNREPKRSITFTVPAVDPVGSTVSVAPRSYGGSWDAFPAASICREAEARRGRAEVEEQPGSDVTLDQAVASSAAALRDVLNAHMLGFSKGTVTDDDEGARTYFNRQNAAVPFLEQLWAAVHDHPKHTKLDIELPAVSRSLAVLDSEYREVCQKDADREKQSGELDSCVEEFDLAAKGFVPLWPSTGSVGRFFLALSVALFAAYAGYTITASLLRFWAAAGLKPSHRIFDGHVAPLVVGLSGVAGAFAAALLGWGLERFRGSKAVCELNTQFSTLASVDLERHNCCVRLLRRASQFWDALRLLGVGLAQSRLLRRTRSILKQKLHPQSVLAEESDGLDPIDPMEGSGGELSPMRLDEWKQLEHDQFSEASTIVLDIDTPIKESEIRTVVDKQLSGFLDRWRELCRDCDAQFTGRLPAMQLVPFLDGFVRSLETDVRNEIRTLCVGKVSRDAKALAKRLGQERALRRGGTEQYHYFVSCQVPQGASYRRSYLLHPQWDQRIRDAIDDIQNPRRMDPPIDQTVVAYVFDIGNASFGVGSNGLVVATGVSQP